MNFAGVATLLLLLNTQVFGRRGGGSHLNSETSENIDCSSQSCLNDPSCIDKCLEEIDLFGSETSGNLDCSSQSCLNDPACLDNCLDEHAKFEVEASKKVFERLDALENENDHLKNELSNLENHIESLEEIHEKETLNITDSLNLVENRITELENSQPPPHTQSHTEKIREFVNLHYISLSK